MVVDRLKVLFEKVVEADGMAMDEVDVEWWTKARREQAVDEQSVDGQASFVEDAARLGLSGKLLIEKQVLLP